MAYADNPDKVRGIAREPIVAERIRQYLTGRKGLTISMQKSSLLEDIRQKYDYSYQCAKDEYFDTTNIVQEIKVDIKCGKSLTLIDDRGINTLENSKSDFIVFEVSEGAELIWVNTYKLKECLKINKPNLRISKYNFSQYFFIEEYLTNNRKFLGQRHKC